MIHQLIHIPYSNSSNEQQSLQDFLLPVSCNHSSKPLLPYFCVWCVCARTHACTHVSSSQRTKKSTVLPQFGSSDTSVCKRQEAQHPLAFLVLDSQVSLSRMFSESTTCTVGASSECVIILHINLPLLATLSMHCCMSVETWPAWTTAYIKQRSWSRVCPVFPGSMDTLLRRRLCLLAFEQVQFARKASSSNWTNPTSQGNSSQLPRDRLVGCSTLVQCGPLVADIFTLWERMRKECKQVTQASEFKHLFTFPGLGVGGLRSRHHRTSLYVFFPHLYLIISLQGWAPISSHRDTSHVKAHLLASVILDCPLQGPDSR